MSEESNSRPPELPFGSPEVAVAKVYRCGTLQYTKSGLFVLFAWLLWGDFCYSLMEVVRPTIIPLQLKALGASPLTMQLILSTIPSILNLTICPWVSYKSDRHRGRMGRRIPFILYTLPFLSLSLILMGWSRDITPWLQHLVPPLHGMAPATVTIGLIAVFGTAFAFFNMFVGSVFYYLFNDVVPPQFLARFTGLFTLVGNGAGILYQFFIYGHAQTHMREIFTGAALYCIGFSLVCFRTKEGEYPPPAPQAAMASRGGNLARRIYWYIRGRIANIVEYFRQSFSARIYWYIFLFTTFGAIGGAMSMYWVFLDMHLGLTLDQIGHKGGYCAIAGFLATYITAVFVDRWHPLRVASYLAVFTAVSGFGGWIWVYVTLPANVYYWLMLGWSLSGVFSNSLGGATQMPLCMRLFPKSVYGQFSSAQAMLRSLGSIGAGLVAGALMILILKACQGSVFAGHDSDFGYRFIFLWGWIFSCVSATFICLAYREWRRLGADDKYQPPAPWLPGGVEEVLEKVASVPAKPRAVMTAMWLNFAFAVLSGLLVVEFIRMMQNQGMVEAKNWYLWTFMPFKVLFLGISWVQLVHVKRDIEAAARGERTRFGVPHHGVLLVYAIQNAACFPIFWLQTAWTIRAKLEGELILFGIASVLGFAAGIVGLQILRWLERPLASDVGEDGLMIDRARVAGEEPESPPEVPEMVGG